MLCMPPSFFTCIPRFALLMNGCFSRKCKWESGGIVDPKKILNKNILTMHAIVILFQVHCGIYYFTNDYLARHSKCRAGKLVVHIIF